MISAILAKVKGLQSQKYKKMTKKAYLDADLRVGSHFGLLRGQNGSKLEKAFFPPKPDLAGLMIGPKTLSFWPFWPKL